METIAWMEKYMAEVTNMFYEGRVDEGLHALNDLLFEEPGYGSLHNYLGWAYMYYTNDTAKAELHLKTAIHFACNYGPPYLHMGNLLNRTARYKEALGYFTAGLNKQNAIHAALYEGMGYAYELTGDYRQAIQAYRNAANASVADHEVNRFLNGVKRCRKKRIALFFSF